MATKAKKAKIDPTAAAAGSAKLACPYKASCYRKNPLHFKEFSHPGDADHVADGTSASSTAASSTSTSSSAASSTSTSSSVASSTSTSSSAASSTSTSSLAVSSTSSLAASSKAPSTSATTADGVAGKSSTADSSSSLPPCKYGAKCYRKNLLHFAEYSHPTLGPTSASAKPADGDSSDTDVYDSDEDDKAKKKAVTKDGKGVDILSRGMSLVKSYSQMTETERKELIHKAFEAKQQLQKELADTRKRVAEKDEKLRKLQEEVNKGLMFVDGEDEALQGSKTAYFELWPERNYKEGSADQIHFRLAESQFYRLISGQSSVTYRVKKVEYVVTPSTVKQFKAARENIRKERGEKFSYPLLAFHGTDAKNITPICEKGFKVPGQAGFKHKTDSGWYGAGVYFSEYPSYSMGYINGANKLLLCQVLPGKVFECTSLIHGASLTKGYDSHMSPCKKELVIFNSHHILPSYIVHYDHSNTEFKYQKVPKKPQSGKTPTPEELKKKKTKALKAPASSILAGQTVKYVGPKDEEADIYKLVLKHSGVKGTIYKYTVVVAHQDTKNSKVIQTALDKDIPVVTAEYLYETIVQQDAVDVRDYSHPSTWD